MRALVSMKSAPFAELAEAADPTPLPDEALVEVEAISLNRGETRRLEQLEPGTITGWDLAGTVRRAAADGSGPPEGARVVGLMNAGAWAELAAVKTERLAELPDGVSVEQAAALPVAGLTALRALEVAGFVLGKRVLVTGASGGVGRFAIQLAKLAGAHVTGISRRTEGLKELGADELAPEIDLDGPVYEAILDAVGGPVLGAALRRVAPGGTVVSFASTVTEPVSYPAREFFARAPRAQLYGFYLFDIIDHTRSGAVDLRRLADLVAEKRLDPQIDLTLPWTEAAQAIEALMDRRVNGKAVLTLDSR
ncbi:MAG TPA: zinc-binding dehydrogenase [Solirubrobacteraceae bacterium]|nr:zinc-binding dehydrogenase [Solirubrobacteraceae bacterium]